MTNRSRNTAVELILVSSEKDAPVTLLYLWKRNGGSEREFALECKGFNAAISSAKTPLISGQGACGGAVRGS